MSPKRESVPSPWTWIVLTSLILFSPPARSWACYAVIVGRAASADGSVLVGHNEQNYGQRILNFRRIPRQQYTAGAEVQLSRGGSLEQVPETSAFLWSENPGLEFSDAYLNEWGVAIVSDGCATREDDYQTLVARGEIRHGGIGYMLRRLVAQRAKTARQGVELAGELVERFGYSASGRTYVIADPEEAWLFAAVRGRRWAARRVPDDVVVLLPNVHIIGELDLSDGDNFLASPDLIDYAVGRGWFDPTSGEKFNFRKVYTTGINDSPDPRRWRGRQLVTGNLPGPLDGPLSFGVRPERKMTVAKLIEILRDTHPAAPLSTSVTQEAAVFQLRDDLPREIGCIYWRTTAEPATSFLTPWYLGITDTPQSYFRGAEVERQLSLDHHFQPPSGSFDSNPESAWWTFKRLQDLIRSDYPSRIKVAQPRQAAFEDHLFANQEVAEERALKLWKTDAESTRRYLTRYCHDVAREARRQAEELIDVFETKRRRSR